MKKTTGQLILILLLLVLDTAILRTAFGASNELEVHFLDVGQGDSILFETPSGERVLVDTGKPGTSSSVLPRFIPFYDRKIDLLVLSHSDLDHIGDAPEILKQYEVETLLISGNYEEGEMEKEIMRLASLYGVDVITALRGQNFSLGGLTGTVLFPDRNTEKLESNTGSIGLKISYGETDIILTGDMPSGVEDYLANIDGQYLGSEILKLGHHGSKTSTSDKFLTAVAPDYAVISAGEGNSYGHPHKEVLDKLNGLEIVDMTKSDKTVTFVTDGFKLELID